MEGNKVDCFLFELISPEKFILSERVTSVVLPSASGYLTVMANHAPLVLSVVLGSVRVLSSSGERLFAVFGGVADVNSAGCSLLAERVIAVEHLSFDALEQKISHVRAALEGKSDGESNHEVEKFFRQLTGVDGALMEA
ncbi:F0F1 ATP synthase subunit epsilon [Bartonella sp. CB178]|uniref:F0F1 ATP synthase subunit epsilon n=1 Tax=Bartonella sp. CB178 TaxID=3112255 RepID=UPI00300E2967